MVVLKVTVASLFVLLSACTVGEVTGSGGGPVADAPATPIDAAPGGSIDAPGGGVDAEALFNSDVKPLISAKDCARSMCHAPATVTPDLSSYSALLASNSGKYVKNPGAANVLATKASTAHNGATFTAAEVAKIAAWIDIAGPD